MSIAQHVAVNELQRRVGVLEQRLNELERTLADPAPVARVEAAPAVVDRHEEFESLDDTPPKRRGRPPRRMIEEASQ